MDFINKELTPPESRIIQNANADASKTYASKHDPNDARSTPDNGSIGGIFGGWDCQDWITWHKALVRTFGEQQAHETWTRAWNEQGFFDTDVSWCKYKSDFNEYVRANKLDVSWALPDVINDANDAVVNTSQAIVNTSNVIKILVPVMLITATVIASMYFYKSYAK